MLKCKSKEAAEWAEWKNINYDVQNNLQNLINIWENFLIKLNDHK